MDRKQLVEYLFQNSPKEKNLKNPGVGRGIILYETSTVGHWHYFLFNSKVLHKVWWVYYTYTEEYLFNWGACNYSSLRSLTVRSVAINEFIFNLLTHEEIK